MRYQAEESIYSLVPRKARQTEKAERYVSKNKSGNLVGESTVDQQRAKKESHLTMGLANEHADVYPHSFLKKKQTEPKSKEPVKTTFPSDGEPKKSSVPRAKDAPPLMGIQSTKNFITTNAVENIMAVPKKPAANMADTRHGDSFPLEESGLVPKYRNKKDFGNTPGYIVKRAEEMKRAQEEYDGYVKEHMRRVRFAELLKKYTSLSICSDPGCHCICMHCKQLLIHPKERRHEANHSRRAPRNAARTEEELGGGDVAVPVSAGGMRQPLPQTHQRETGSTAEEHRTRHRTVRETQDGIRRLKYTSRYHRNQPPLSF